MLILNSYICIIKVFSTLLAAPAVFFQHCTYTTSHTSHLTLHHNNIIILEAAVLKDIFLVGNNHNICMLFFKIRSDTTTRPPGMAVKPNKVLCSGEISLLSNKLFYSSVFSLLASAITAERLEFFILSEAYLLSSLSLRSVRLFLIIQLRSFWKASLSVIFLTRICEPRT